MTVFHADLAALAVPRYTSYPTAVEFSGQVGPDQYAAALHRLSAADHVSLYLHIPYCHQICWYCGCNTGAAGRTSRLEIYVDALIAEIALVAASVGARVKHVHFGGGSPNALTPRQFERLVVAIRRNFTIDHDAEWAAELDPRHLNVEFCRALSRSGIRRVSLGAQTFDLGVQARINRLQPYRLVAQQVAELRKAGIAHINLDLMYGLPGQTLDSIARTVSLAKGLAPDRVAMFGYAHLPRMLPRQRMIDERQLPDAEARFWQSILSRDLWEEAGLQAVGFDHYARPDDNLALAAASGNLRRNFQGFTDDNCQTVIGLGASAISSFPDLIVQSEKHVGQYRMRVGNGRFATTRGKLRSNDDQRRGQIIERLLCTRSVDLTALGWTPADARQMMADAATVLTPLAERGLVSCHDTGLSITTEGAPYARIAASAFDRYRTPSAERFSAAI
ncbi:MAG: oxygen-independent coproporphyrinogen III oxidase [Sphingomonas sp.]|uniref:oxygen-independent coproporphyrinogen III oxidase n=1 Tax=Sphingomonas sp. TaxID=28214 RepID=UPI001AC97218|nr:oxygen-independent coproporphyrinogen III oxidase [Sphingomonas sp.]MBN8816237.1 oxygen-independent coproporphyrinogen III oxidase [Sphingomonas sp.]